MHTNSEKGFIALISAIIIAAILLLVMAAMGATVFFSRFNLLDSELKERSVAAADACADRALVQLALDPTYTGSVLTLNTLDECRIGKVADLGSTMRYQVQATSSDEAVTNLRIVVNAGDLSRVSQEEIAVY